MFNPSMYENAKKNMTKDQMQMAANMMANMSDDDLRNYAKMAGMPTMNPQMMRQNIGMMKNIDDSQFNNFKNMAQNVNYPYPGAQGGSTSTQSSGSNTSSSSTKYTTIESLKTKGNDHFKKGENDQASAAYLEAILEIDGIRAKSGNTSDSELDNLEVSCRLNYATVKAKLNDFEAVLAHASAALKIKENGKAYYRIGQALHHFGKNEKAFENLKKAKTLINDDPVNELYDKVKALVGDIPSAKEPETTEPEQDISSSKEEYSQPKKSNLRKKNAPEVDSSFAKDTPKPKPRDPNSYYSNSTNDVTIEEEEKSTINTSSSSTSNNTSNNAGFGGMPRNMDPENIKKGQEQLNNMSPDQLKMMTDQFKHMDKSFIKQMMRQQTGMDMKDEDIERMKSWMTPEMLQGLSKMDMGQMSKMGGMGGFGGQPSNQNSMTNEPGSQTNIQNPPSMPTSLSDINGDMIKNMMSMLENNPEMLKNMAGMLGENHPLANMVKNKSPEELKKMIGMMKKAAGVFGFFSPAYKVVKKYWQLILGALIGYILYRLMS